MKIWQRYLLRSLARSFLFFLLCILLFYIAIDFSLHGHNFFSQETSSWYLRHFAKFIPLFFSLSFLLALLKVLSTLTASREITALQIAGLSLRQLLSPFFYFAALLSLLTLINYQWLLPKTGQSLDSMNQIHSTVLQDGSELVYQTFDERKNELFDVFWISSFEEFWHIKYLLLDTNPPVGRCVDYFHRKTSGLERCASYTTHPFPGLSFKEGLTLHGDIPFENRPLSTLWQQSSGNHSDQKKSASYLHYKLAHSSLFFLIALLIPPFAMRYSRTKQSFALIALSLFAFVGLMALLDTLVILAENQVLPAKYAIWVPLIALSTRIHWKKLLQ